jgi:hypothetical protein
VITRVEADHVDRIAASIKDAPDDLDRGELLRELNIFLADWRLADHDRCAPARRCKEIDKAIAAAEKLREQIKEIGGLLLTSRYDANLQQLIADLNKLRSPADQLPEADLGTIEDSVFEHFVGHRLRQIYETHFKTQAGYKKNPYAESSEVTGSFIDFTEATLKELQIFNNGKPYARNTISNALSKVRG